MQVSKEGHVIGREEQNEPVRYIESGNIIIPSNIAARHPQSQIILVQVSYLVSGVYQCEIVKLWRSIQV